MKHADYPAPRPRPEGARPGLVEKYERYQSTEGFLAVADTDTEVITFAGRPDSIVLTARVADAIVTLRSRWGSETDEFPVLAGATLETRLSAEVVFARERVAAAGAELFVVGKWAQPTAPA